MLTWLSKEPLDQGDNLEFTQKAIITENVANSTITPFDMELLKRKVLMGRAGGMQAVRHLSR